MSNSDLDWTIRPAQGGDLPFIYDTWMKSYRYNSIIGKSLSNNFYDQYNRVIDWILTQNDTKVSISCYRDNPDVIFGYMVTQPKIIHYAFTKHAFCNMGISRSLFVHSDCGADYYTHRTLESEPILEKHPELIYNPFILFKGVQAPWQNPLKS